MNTDKGEDGVANVAAAPATTTQPAGRGLGLSSFIPTDSFISIKIFDGSLRVLS